MYFSARVTAVSAVVESRSRNSRVSAPAPVAPAALDTLLLTSKDSRPGYSGRARAAHCSSRTRSALGNPWTCLVRYPHPPSVRFHVTVHADRSISGFGQPAAGALLNPALTVSGCCVETP